MYCVVRKAAEANETSGVTNMEVQSNVDFSSSGNDIINFAYHEPDGEKINGQDGKHAGTLP